MVSLKKLVWKREKKIGLPPGTPVFVGEKKTEETKITILDYDETQFQQRDVKEVEECFPFKETPTVTWINVDGLHDVEVIEKIGKNFDMHPLILETNGTQVEQVSLILGKKYVISFQEREGDIFNPIRERIRNGKGRIRKMGSDYLAYALLDAVVDHYFIILEKDGEKIEVLEDKVVTDPRPDTLHEIHKLKRDMIFLRRSVWPLRELISGLERLESSLIHKSTHIYLRSRCLRSYDSSD